MMAMVGHRSVTSSTMWVDRITATFSPISASRLRKRLRSSGSRPAVGSSTMTSFGVAEQRLGDAEALAHAAGKAAELLLAHRPQVDLLQQALDHLATLLAIEVTLERGKVVEQVFGD
jgi:hypothetical protein